MNALYDTARRRMLSNQFNWTTMAVRMLAFVDNYTFDGTDNTVADIGFVPAAESQLLTGKSVSTRGFAAGDQAWFQTPPLSSPWKFLVLVDDTAPGLSDRPLIAYYDTGINIPRVINGQDEVVIPDWLAQQGWFQP